MGGNWRQMADKLSEHGVPQRRAEVVALLSSDHTHADVQETLGLSNRSEVAVHVDRYRTQDLPNARWLAENAPEL